MPFKPKWRRPSRQILKRAKIQNNVFLNTRLNKYKTFSAATHYFLLLKLHTPQLFQTIQRMNVHIIQKQTMEYHPDNNQTRKIITNPEYIGLKKESRASQSI
jgi:hypothetical protein